MRTSILSQMTYPIRNTFLMLSGLLAFASCSSIKDSPKYQLNDDRYEFRQEGHRYRKVQLYVNEDTIALFSADKTEAPLIPEPRKDQFYRKRSFDIDVITVPFKFRPGTAGLPQQLTTDFNGHVFFGYRVDRFRVVHKQTPVGWKQTYHHRGLSAGAFGGLGSTAVTPWTTSNKINEEYNGLVLSRGLAVMIGLNNLTVGVGIGWDHLTDRDRAAWIYENTPWYGLTLGLNLN